MFLEGSIFNGAIVLDESTTLPDGTRVRVEPIAAPAPTADAAPSATPARKPIASLRAVKERLARERANPPPADGPTLAERLKDFISHNVELPPDASLRIDFYLEHGLPHPERAT